MRGKKKRLRRGANPGKAKVDTRLAGRRPAPTPTAQGLQLEQRLAEALEQQAATSEILRVISSSPHDVQPVFDAIVQNAVRLCDGLISCVFRYDGERLHFVGHHNFPPAALDIYQRTYPLPLDKDRLLGRAILERRPVNVADVFAEFRSHIGQRELGNRSILAVPMLRDGTGIGVIAVSRAVPGLFPEHQVALLETFAAQAVIAIENVRLFTEAQARNRALSEALEQQTATSEILRVISSSPTDLGPAMSVVAESAARLCEAADAVVWQRDGERLRVVASHGGLPMTRRELTISRQSVGGRAIIDRRAVHVADLAEALDREFPDSHGMKELGYRTVLAMPLVREGEAIGLILLRRTEVRPFSDGHVALLGTFAAQAVIAIENVRLFKELEARNRDLAATLEQQTATSDILRIISSSPTGIEPTFDAIARSATALCDADTAGVFRFDGELVHFVAQHGRTPEEIEVTRRAFPQPPRHQSPAGRAILAGAVIQIADVSQHPEVERAARIHGTMLSVPLIRDGRPLGSITLARRAVLPFTDKQIDLVKTFAEQAVIAIENVRLFKELEARNRDLTETLEQQTATGEILRVISSSPTDVQPVFDTVAESAARLCEAADVVIFRRDRDRLRLAAHHGPIPVGPIGEFSLPLVRGSLGGRSVLEARTLHVADLQTEDNEFPDSVEHARHMGFHTILAVPLMREGVAIGGINLRRTQVQFFTDRQIALLKTFADQAVIAIENVRLFKELETRNRDLTETLEQQTATGEILRVISSSPTDVQPVFDTIVQNAKRLCEAEFSFVFRFDGQLLHFAAHHGLTPEGITAMRDTWPMAPNRASAAGRSMLDRAIAHIADVRSEPDYGHGAVAEVANFRSIVAVPMMRDGLPIGVITVNRSQAGPFPDRQIELLKTFADQAVIAIENVRLFNELDVRNHDLTETLEQQTATGEILRVISSSPTDVQPVFDIIGERAEKLCDAAISVVSRFDGELIHMVSLHGVAPERVKAIQDAFPMRPDDETVSARAVRTRAVVHVPDVLADAQYQQKGAARASGYRGCLAVPMVRDGQVIGAIFVARTAPGLFTDTQVELLKTFADQAVIAVQNVRLFQELEARNSDLIETLEQQTATGEILRVISSSPTDVQPVFDSIAQSAKRLCEAQFCQLYRFDGKLLHFVAHHGLSPEGAEAVRRAYPMAPGRGSAAARSIVSGAIEHIADVHADPDYGQGSVARAANFRSIVAVPMMRDGLPIGSIAVARTETGLFPDRKVDLLKTFADQAVIAVQNVHLFQELEARNRDLTETLEQQTATGEILRVISSSPTDVQPVFDTIAQSANRLCEAEFCAVLRFDGDFLHFVAHHGLSADAVEATRGVFPLAADRGSAGGRSILSAAVTHIPDVQADPEYRLGALARIATYRSIVAVPMIRDGMPIGTIAVQRAQVGHFPARQIALLQTFADQAVIAVENVRLFQELEARTHDLTRSVGELQALGEVSQAVSSTLDLETVLATIVSRAVQLSGSHGGVVYEFDEDTQSFHARATHQVTAEHLEALRAAPIRLGEGAIGHAGVVREPVQIADIQDERQLVAPQARDHLIRQGMRSLLAMPLIREDRLLGGIVITRREVGAFSPAVVTTLQTFASQSVLAFQNARLFREIQRQKRYSEMLVETSPVAIATLDLHGVVVGWNPGAERLFGYTQAEAQGRRMEELVATPEVLEEVRANVRQTVAGEWIRAIGRRARKDGSLVDVEISSVPVVVDGARVGMIGIYHDITELLQARREAEAANEAKGAFLATMSHEIRTPMNAVIGMSGLLLNTALTDEQREYAEIVRQSGDTLLTVINDILDFSKIEAGRLELESQPFDVRECVESALDLVASRAAEKGLDLAYLLGDGTPTAIVGDVTRLRQVLLNLLSNAVKFTERGEVVLSVSARRLKGAAGLHELTFSVRDTGIGIPTDRLGRLFQSFSQVDASTTRRYGGTGLGLAISQRLTELMSGRITVTSEVGVGSDFRFTIRASPATVPIPTRRDLTGVQPSLQGKRVLVVDDNATNRRILTSHLEVWGMLTRATEAPVEALGWIREGERFDIGILDMHMPEMDGVTLARAVREQPAGTALPLILFTSLGRREARAEEAGFAAYLNKPIKPSQLFDALVSVLAEQPVHVQQRRVERSELDPEMAGRHPLRILLAEDNVVNQKVAIRLLGQMGYRADVAANGLEAIEAVERQTYDVVLMDVQMPELDGFEASREINRRWPGKRPRIVAMTANAMEGDRELCVAAGMDDYVAKPIRVEELVGALGRCQPRGIAGARRDAAPDVGGTTPAVAGVIDRAVIERLTATMGRAFAVELIDAFIDDARQLVAAFRKALTATDRDAFRRAAHSLKSTSESLGAFGLATLARELETVGQAGRLHEVGDRLERLTSQSELVIRALGEIRHGLAE